MYQYPDYLLHYGVPGMKWGVRRKITEYGTPKKNYRSSRRNDKRDRKIAKEYARVLNTRDRVNGNKVYKQFNNEVKSSKAYKDYERSIKKQLKTGEYTKDDYVAEVNYSQYYNKVGKKYTDKCLSATLKDLGFKDSEEGRKYIAYLSKKVY